MEGLSVHNCHKRVRPIGGPVRLFVIRIHSRTLSLQKLGGPNGCRNRLERNRWLRQIEAVRKVVGVGIGVAQRVQAESGLDVPQDAPEIVCGMRNMLRFGVRRHHD